MRWPGVHPGSSPLPPAGACEFSSLGAADGRNRDLFPLPTDYFTSSSASQSSVCRAVRRRLSKASYVNQWSNECAAALNEVQSGRHTNLLHLPRLLRRSHALTAFVLMCPRWDRLRKTWTAVEPLVSS